MILRLSLLLAAFATLPSLARGADSPQIEFEGKSLSKWLEELKKPNAADRAKAQSALEKIARDNREAVREIVAAIVDLPIKRKEPDLSAMETFGPLLYEIGRPAALALHPYLWGEDPDKKFRALLALAMLSHRAKPAAPGLIEIVEHEKDELVFKAAMLVLERGPDPIYLPAILQALESEDLNRVFPAVQVLTRGEYPVAKYIGVMKKWLGREDAFRTGGLFVLKKLGREAAPATEALMQILNGGKKEHRVDAAFVLKGIGRPARAAIPALEKAVMEDDGELTLVAAEALARMGEAKTAKPHLLKIVKDAKSKDRMKAAGTLWKLDRSPDVIAAIKDVLTDLAAEERDAALELAAVVGPRGMELVPELVKAIAIPKSRMMAIASLGRMGPDAKAAAKSLKVLFSDDDPFTRMLAASAMARIDLDAATLQCLEGALSSDDAKIRRFAAVELGVLGQWAKAAVPAIRTRLNDEDSDCRIGVLEALWLIDRDKNVLTELQKAIRESKSATAAALALGDLFKSDAAVAIPDLLMALWKDPSQSSTAETIGRMGVAGKKAMPALIRLIKSEGLEQASYSAAAEALGLFGPEAKAAIPALLPLLQHDEALTRVHAALALWRIDRDRRGAAALAEARISRKYSVYITALEAEWLMKHDPQTVRDLIDELREASMSFHDMSPNWCYMLARALARVGTPAKDALPDLRDLLFHSDPSLRRQAADAIALIEGKK